MHNKVVFNAMKALSGLGWPVLRFNFRGAGLSEGKHDDGRGEAEDVRAALDWLQIINRESRGCWIAGFSFGAWIGMQLLMRRPEISGFISVSPPANMYDFGFLAPCPSSGLVLQGDVDDIVPQEAVNKLVHKLSHQRDIQIDYRIVEGANHFYDQHEQEVIGNIAQWLGRFGGTGPTA